MEKIKIDDFDFCRGCKLVDMYNELVDINNEHQKINGELREENKQLKEELELEKNINEKDLIFIDELEETIDKALNLVNEYEVDLLVNSNWLKELSDALKGDSNE